MNWESLPRGSTINTAAEKLRPVFQILFLVLLIYLFLVAIQLFGGAIKMLGRAAAESLTKGLENPFAGLAVGVLSTVLVQSSSVTTSLVVGMVGTGVLPLAIAVPMIMGANVGTSVTNTLVALGHVTRNNEFRRAFAGATVHDFFNLMTVGLLFPLELTTGFLRRGAVWLVSVLPLGGTGGHFKSPVKTAVKWLAKLIESNCESIGLTGRVLAGAMIVIALLLVLISLSQLTRTMKGAMANQIELWLNRVLGGTGTLALIIGVAITVLVQSSSITTSLLVPMFGAGLLSLDNGFPIMVGANIGTTVTALMAASVTGPEGLTIAVVHLLFNVCGTLIFMPLAPIRRLPLMAAGGLAHLAVRNRMWVLIYIGATFVAGPVLGILIWRS